VFIIEKERASGKKTSMPSKGKRAGDREKDKKSITNFIWPYLYQFFDDSHSLNSYRKPSKRPFDKYQSCLKAINIG